MSSPRCCTRQSEREKPEGMPVYGTLRKSRTGGSLTNRAMVSDAASMQNDTNRFSFFLRRVRGCILRARGELGALDSIQDIV